MLVMVLLFAHVLSDFVFQTTQMVREKSQLNPRGFLKHGAVLFFTALPVIFVAYPSEILWRIALVSVLHIVVDIVKEGLQRRVEQRRALEVARTLLFAADQAVHIALIFIVARGVPIRYHAVNAYFVETFLNGNGLSYEEFKAGFIVLYAALSGIYFVPLLFDIAYRKVPDYAAKLNDQLKVDLVEADYDFIDEVKTGKWIGVFERFLIAVFLLAGQLASIGFVVALKSLARFKMMAHKIFAEYFLLGTLFSVGYTFILYAVFQKLL